MIICSSIPLDELHKLAYVHSYGSGERPNEQLKGPPALELSTHKFQPVVANKTLSSISLTPLWRLAAAITGVQLILVVFYPWSLGALEEYFTFVSHPVAVAIFFVASTLVSERTEYVSFASMT